MMFIEHFSPYFTTTSKNPTKKGKVSKRKVITSKIFRFQFINQFHFHMYCLFIRIVISIFSLLSHKLHYLVFSSFWIREHFVRLFRSFLGLVPNSVFSPIVILSNSVLIIFIQGTVTVSTTYIFSRKI